RLVPLAPPGGGRAAARGRRLGRARDGRGELRRTRRLVVAAVLPGRRIPVLSLLHGDEPGVSGQCLLPAAFGGEGARRLDGGVRRVEPAGGVPAVFRGVQLVGTLRVNGGGFCQIPS